MRIEEHGHAPRTEPLDQHLTILDAYADPGVESHWYTVPPVAQERILRAAEVLDVRDLVRVWDWPLVAHRRGAPYGAAARTGLVADDQFQTWATIRPEGQQQCARGALGAERG